MIHLFFICCISDSTVGIVYLKSIGNLNLSLYCNWTTQLFDFQKRLPNLTVTPNRLIDELSNHWCHVILIFQMSTIAVVFWPLNYANYNSAKGCWLQFPISYSSIAICIFHQRLPFNLSSWNRALQSKLTGKLFGNKRVFQILNLLFWCPQLRMNPIDFHRQLQAYRIYYN